MCRPASCLRCNLQAYDYTPNLLDRLAALSSIERLPRRARSYGLVWARGIVTASAWDKITRTTNARAPAILTHARAAPVQSVLASSSPASGDPSSPTPGPRPTPRPAQHSVIRRSMPHLPHPLRLKAGSDEAPKRSRAQAGPCRHLRYRLTLHRPYAQTVFRSTGLKINMEGREFCMVTGQLWGHRAKGSWRAGAKCMACTHDTPQPHFPHPTATR